MNTQTQEAFEKFWNTEIVSAVTGSVDTAMWGDIDRNDTAYIFMAGFKACKEALAQQEQTKADFDVMAYGQSFMLDGKHIPVSEVHEQPAQAITEGSQLSNIKAGSRSEKPSPPPAPKHTCTYSKTINQEYPRKCIHCGEVEALAQPAQEPVAWTKQSELDKTTTLRCPIVMWKNQYASIENNIPLYTHPAPTMSFMERAGNENS